MTVAELIRKLEQFDSQLPVALADWQEEYRPPSFTAANIVELVQGPVGELTPPDKYIRLG